MQLRWKKQIFNWYIGAVILIMPVLVFLLLGFDVGLFPDFWGHMEVGESAAGADTWVVSHVRYMISFVDSMEFYFAYIKHLLPLLTSLCVIPFIQMRDRLFPFERVRAGRARRMECKWAARSVLFAGCVMFAAYLYTVLWARILFVHTCDEDNCFDVFLEQWGWAFSAREHPYLYVLLLGVLRCFLIPVMYAALTVAVSYLTKKLYIYMIVPTVYDLLTYPKFSQSIHDDKWPLPLFSPENMMWPSSPDYWDYGHTLHGIWGVAGAFLIVVVPSAAVIWYRIRRREV